MPSEVPPTPWQRAQSGRRANRSENQGARAEGGKRQPASGSKHYAKGDYKANGYLVEDKTTDASSYRIEASDWVELAQNAMKTPPGLKPTLRIQIVGIPRLRLILDEEFLYLCAQAGQLADIN